MDSNTDIFARLSSKNTWYDRLPDTELWSALKARGLGTAQTIAIKALIEQDRVHAAAAFRLMSLPPELRNRIYEYSLVYGAFFGHRSYYFNEKGQPALTRVSSQVRKESLSIYFGFQSLALAVVLISPPKGLLLEDSEPMSSRTHTLDKKSLYRLGHIFSHTDLLRQVTLEMDIAVRNHRPIDMVLVIRRDVQATPQYSVEVSYGRRLHYILQQQHGCIGDIGEEEMTWAERPRLCHSLAKRHGESIAKFIGRRAQSILDQ